MNIQPIPHEQGRFVVHSESRPDVAFVVDLRYQPTYTNPISIAACGCEDYMANENHFCKHIEQVVAYEQRRLGL